jgi:hypothetical protein
MLDRRISPPLASLLVLALALVLPAAARGDGVWQPLDVLTHWHYAVDGGGGEDVTITGTTTLLSRTVAVKHYSGGIDDGLDQYWLTGPDGEVLLAGFNRPGFGLAYDPPIALLETPPALGLTWWTDATIHLLPALTVSDSLHIQWAVFEDVVLDLPIGSLPAFGVGQTGAAVAAPAAATLAASRGFTIDGRRIPDGATTNVSNATDWYSENIGVVQYQVGGTYHRLTTFDRPDAVARSSWGRIKRIYR